MPKCCATAAENAGPTWQPSRTQPSSGRVAWGSAVSSSSNGRRSSAWNTTFWQAEPDCSQASKLSESISIFTEGERGVCAKGVDVGHHDLAIRLVGAIIWAKTEN